MTNREEEWKLLPRRQSGERAPKEVQSQPEGQEPRQNLRHCKTHLEQAEEHWGRIDKPRAEAHGGWLSWAGAGDTLRQQLGYAARGTGEALTSPSAGKLGIDAPKPKEFKTSAQKALRRRITPGGQVLPRQSEAEKDKGKSTLQSGKSWMQRRPQIPILNARTMRSGREVTTVIVV
ncbi:hypothetical protein HAX54_040152 [Datura stramonium]|uniref:Uncharacterized protein n=1 Tax=Datura stramonium TaxID=4076 RepID=A0ABS8VNT5_DATST|nr:hypothetical protein [Datura stramonium]